MHDQGHVQCMSVGPAVTLLSRATCHTKALSNDRLGRSSLMAGNDLKWLHPGRWVSGLGFRDWRVRYHGQPYRVPCYGCRLPKDNTASPNLTKEVLASG